MQLPDTVGILLEQAMIRLEESGFEVLIVEAVDKKTVKTEEARVIRQRSLTDKTVELTISYF